MPSPDRTAALYSNSQCNKDGTHSMYVRRSTTLHFNKCPLISWCSSSPARPSAHQFQRSRGPRVASAAAPRPRVPDIISFPSASLWRRQRQSPGCSASSCCRSGTSYSGTGPSTRTEKVQLVIESLGQQKPTVRAMLWAARIFRSFR